MRRHILGTAICAVTAVTGMTATQAGFVNDSQVQLKLRNFYLDRQYAEAPQNNWGSWSQGAMLDVKSGYADLGGVKVGVDVLAQGAIKLKQLHDKPDFVLPYNRNNTGDKAKSSFGKIGATLKAKVSETELKIGEVLPVSPVLHFDPSRQLLTTFTGAWLESKDIKDAKLTLAYINKINTRYDSDYIDLSLFNPPSSYDSSYPNTQKSDGMLIAGVDYQFTKEFAGSYWFADVKDVYKQNYVGLTYNTQLNDQAKLMTYARYFDNSNSGDSRKTKDIDNQAVSLSAKVSYGSHTAGVGYQQMFGETAFPTLGGWVPQPYLVNWGVATFTNAKEKSWNINYTYDFAGLGAKGLTLTGIYFKGSDAEVAGLTDQGSAEWNAIVNYTVPEGPLKGVGIQGMYIDVDYDWKTDLKEYRIATTYTYKF